jgi:hypothetical protein
MSKQALRLVLFNQTIRGIMASEDVSDALTLESWLSSILIASQKVDELSIDARAVLADLILQLLEKAAELAPNLDALLDRILLVAERTMLQTPDELNEVLDSDNEVSSFTKPSGLIVALNSLLTARMVPGQRSREVVSEFFASVCAILTDPSEQRIELPLSDVERHAGKPSHIVYLNASLPVDIPISVTRSQSSVVDSPDMISDSLRLQINESLCTSNSTCNVTLIFQNTAFINYSTIAINSTAHSQTYKYNDLEPDILSVNCMAGEIMNYSKYCPDVQTTIFIECDGELTGVAVARCPEMVAVPSCAARVNGYDLRPEDCAIVDYTSYNTTCSCSISGNSFSTIVDMQTGAVQALGSVEFVAMLDNSVKEFISTWTSTEDLSVASVKASWRVLVTVGACFGAAVLLALAGSYLDISTASKADCAGPAKLSTIDTLAPKDLVDSSLPQIFREDSFTTKFIKELKVYHRWFGVIFFYSEHYSRAMRTLSLTTSVLVMLFANALTYNIANPDDGSCQTHTNPEDCLAEDATYTTGTKCYWGQSGTAGEYACFFREPGSDMKQIIFVAVISAILSTPLAVLADTVIVRYISSPTLSDKPGSVGTRYVERFIEVVPRDRLDSAETGSATAEASDVTPLSSPRRSSVFPDTLGALSHATVNVEALRKSALGSVASLRSTLFEDMNQLVADLRSFRLSLSTQERAAFDGKCTLLSYLYTYRN